MVTSFVATKLVGRRPSYWCDVAMTKGDNQ